jgi:hypothetical protein
MPELIVDGDRRLIVAGAFRLVFSWAGERWVHSLEHQGRGAASHRVLALSTEGDPDRDDPTRVVSPTYQDLQFQEDGAKIQALLVGQSGPHHFSAVFDVEQRFPHAVTGWPYADPSHDILIKVDVADRCRGPIEALASTYTVDANSSDMIIAAQNIVEWDIGVNRLGLVTDHGGPTQVAWAEAGRRATRVQALASIDRAKATQRFQYLWHWDPDLRYQSET